MKAPRSSENLKKQLISASPLVLLALGLALRIRELAHERPLWNDEAWPLLDLLHQPFSEILHTGQWYGQAIPLGLLAAEKLSLRFFGLSELSVRWLSTVLACLALTAFFALARKLLDRVGTLTALALFALSPNLLWWGSELKHYISDVFFVTGILLLAVRVEEGEAAEGEAAEGEAAEGEAAEAEREQRFARLLSLSCFAAVAFWFSHVIVLVVTAVGLTTAVFRWRTLRTIEPPRLIALAALPLISFAASRALWIIPPASAINFDNSWAGGFAPPLAQGLNLWHWLTRTAWELFDNPFDFQNRWLPLGLAAIGLLSWLRTRTWLATALGLVLVLNIGLSMRRIYPVQARCSTFLIPIAFLLIGEGVSRVARSFGKASTAMGTLLVLLFLGLSCPPYLARILQPLKPRTDVRSLAQRLVQDNTDGTPVFVEEMAEGTLHIYSQIQGFHCPGDSLPYWMPWGKPGINAPCAQRPFPILQGEWVHTLNSDFTPELESLKNYPRVWMLFSFMWFPGEIETKVLDPLKKQGKILRMYHSEDSTLLLFEHNPT